MLVTVVAEARPADDGDGGAIAVGNGVRVLDATAGRSLSDEAMRMVVMAVAPLTAEISAAVGGAGRVIVVHDIRHNEIDFQMEGIAAAVHGWAIAEFGLADREIPVSYDGVQKRYVFELGR